MNYPVEASTPVNAGASATAVTFRPAAAGYVNVSVVATATSAPTNSEPASFGVGVQLLKPDGTPAVPPVGRKLDNAQKDWELILSTGALAAASDLSGDWTVRITNTGQLNALCNLTVRYQIVPGNLGKIDHIVVLMMENRSFDHMLGYLRASGKRPEVDGLTGNEINRFPLGVADATIYKSHHLTNFEEGNQQYAGTQFLTDPGHGWPDVMVQLGSDGAGLATNAGFVENFYTQVMQQKTGSPQPIGDIMGYYDGNDLPVYDLLADEFTICQRWFAPIPTDTFPNRLYAVSGGSEGLIITPPDAQMIANPPGFGRKTIFEVLQDNSVDWMIHFEGCPFALVYTKIAQDATFTRQMRSLSEFYAGAATGNLPSVTWIDPYFTDVPHAAGVADDDHPAGDVTRGQNLVANIYKALSTGPAWAKTLLIITYDEHGGFFDHVLPPGTPIPPNNWNDLPAQGGPQDDDPNLARYGVRVPAFVVSPWVQRRYASNTEFDHTSILRTILLRFCTAATAPQPPVALGPVSAEPTVAAAAIMRPSALAVAPAVVREGLRVQGTFMAVTPSMGKRVDSANDLGSLLSADTPLLNPPQPPPIAVSTAPEVATVSPPGAVLRGLLFGF